LKSIPEVEVVKKSKPRNIISYAQNFEDVVLDRAFGELLPESCGFIDIGAGDPEINSVSKHFIELGWEGVLVEPEAAAFKRLCESYPKSFVTNHPIGASFVRVNYWKYENFELNTCSKARHDYLESQGMPSIGLETIETKTLDWLSLKLSRRPIWVKIDAEGFELPIIKGWNDPNFLPWAFVIETHHLESHELDELNEIMKSRGYLKTLFDGINTFWLHDTKVEYKALFSFGVSVIDGPVVTMNSFASGKIKSQIYALQEVNDALREDIYALQEVNDALREDIYALQEVNDALREDIDALRLSRLFRYSERTRRFYYLTRKIAKKAHGFPVYFSMVRFLILVFKKRNIGWKYFKQLRSAGGRRYFFSRLHYLWLINGNSEKNTRVVKLQNLNLQNIHYNSALSGSRLNPLIHLSQGAKLPANESKSLVFVDGETIGLDVVISTHLNPDSLNNLVLTLLRLRAVETITIVANQIEVRYLDQLGNHDSRVHIVEYDQEFNFSIQTNLGAKYGNAPAILFLNDDIEIPNADFLDGNVARVVNDDLVLGNLLLYPGGRIQHAGMYFDFSGNFHHYGRDTFHPVLLKLNQGIRFRRVSSVTGAAIMISRENWGLLDGFDPQLSQHLQDVDFCLRANSSGMKVEVDLENFLYHYESQTVKESIHEHKVMQKRGNEYKYFMRRWGRYLSAGDIWREEMPSAFIKEK
jgi:FkbM family methyltransferase